MTNNDVLTAAKNGDVEKLDSLIKAGADLSIENHSGSTALGFAAYYEHIDCVHLLTKSKKFYYAKRVYGHNAGRSGKDYFAFTSQNSRDKWINKEKHTAPCGCGGGEREEVKASQVCASIKKSARDMLLHILSREEDEIWQQRGS